MCRLQGLRQPLALGIGRVLKTEPAARVTFAGQQDVAKTLRLAECVATFQQPHQGGRTEFGAAVDVAVFARHHLGQFPAVGGHAQPPTHIFEQAHAALLVADVSGQQLDRCAALAEVVAEAGETHGQAGLQLRRHVQHHHQVHPGVHFGVVVGTLRHAPEFFDLGQQVLQCAAFPQHVKHARGRAFHQAARQLLPDTFGHQRVHLAMGDHLPHQRHGFWRHGEIVKTCGKTRQPQDAHRVLAEGVGHVAQHLVPDVPLSAVRIDERRKISFKSGSSPFGSGGSRY